MTHTALGVSEARSFASVDVAAGYTPPPSAEKEAEILREMLLRLPDAVAYVDADGTMRLVNDAFLDIHGIDRSDIAHLRRPEDRFRWQFETGRQTLTHATLEESVAHMLSRRAVPDGKPNLRQYHDQYFDHRFIPLPEGWTMVVFRDITDLKRQEAELRETAGYLAAVNEVLKTISRTGFDLTTVLGSVITSAVGLSQADSAILYRFRDGACHFEIGHNIPPDYELIERKTRIPPGSDTLVGRVLLDRRTAQIEDVAADLEYGPNQEAARGAIRTLLGVPLLREGTMIGVLALARSHVTPFTDRQIEIVTTFADQAAIAIENARLMQELEATRLEAERERAQMRAILDNTTDGMGLFEPNGDIAWWNEAMYDINAFPRDDFSAFRNVRQAFESQARNGHIGKADQPAEKVVNTYMAAFLSGKPYTTTTRRPNGRWVDVAWRALPNGRRLFTHRDVTALKQQEMELREALDFQSAVTDIMQMLGRAPFDLHAVLEVVVERSCAVIGEQAASIYRYQDGACLFAAGHGISDEFERMERTSVIRPGRGSLVGRVLLERNVVQIVDVATDRDYSEQALAAIGGYRSMIGAPLLVEGEIIGVIALARSAAQPFTDRQIRLLSAFGDQAAVAIERMRLLELQQATGQEAERERALMRAILDNVTDGMGLVEANGDIALWNDAMFTINGFPRDVFDKFKNIREVFLWQSEAGQARTDDPTFELMADRAMSWFLSGVPYSATTRRDDGQWVDVRWRVLPDGRRLITHRDVTALKEHEEELQRARDATEQARKMMETVLDNMRDGAVLWDSQDCWLYANKAFIDIQQTSVERLSTYRHFPDALNALVARDAITRDYADGVLERFHAADGSSHLRHMPNGAWVEGSIIRLADGGRLGVYRDISELKQTEMELRTAKDAIEEKGKQLITILDNLIDGVALYAPNGDILHLNAPCYELNQFPREVFANIRNLREGLRWQILNGQTPTTHEDIEEELDARMAVFHGNQRTNHQRFRYGRWLDVHWLPLPDGGKVVMHRDITELKTRELELQQARDEVERARGLMGTVLDNMLDGVILWAPDGDWQYANKAFCDIQETNAQRLATLRRFDTMMDALLERGLIDGAFRQRAVARFAAADGTTALRPTHDGRWVEGAFHRLADGSTLGVLRDITLLKQQEDRLLQERDVAEKARKEAEAANQAKSTFLATMSHEIRTPMNGVLGMMEVLEHQDLAGAQRSTLSIMRESATALLRIIDDVLDFSKIEAGHMELEQTPFSLSEVVASSVRTLRPRAVAKGVRLAAAIDAGSADALIGDPTRVRQILFNLVGNAVKFTEQGSVHVRAGTEPIGDGRQRVMITVMDTGIGMDQEQITRLFQPFAQADSSTTRRFGGTGLGLSIVRRLSQLMDGDVTVESVPDDGSTFTVTLVLRAAAADVDLDRDIEQPGTLAATGRLLVVDDHPINREVLMRQLTLLGLEADMAEDGVAALELWTPGRYAAVLADIHMPRMDGYGLTAAIRQREVAAGAPRTPIVVVRANAMRGEEDRCLDAGMDAYIAKPVSMSRLREVLLRWMAVTSREMTAPRPTKGGIDRQTLRAWMGDDEATINALLSRFLDTARESRSDLHAKVSAGDLPGTAQAAHKLKGASLLVGASGLGEVADQIETAEKAGQLKACTEAMPRLDAELAAAEAAVAQPPPG